MLLSIKRIEYRQAAFLRRPGTCDCIGGSATLSPKIDPILKRRSRIVSFRLSDEEYDSLKNVSATRGARSVSAFTRSVACNSNGDGAEKIEDTLRTLNKRMELLDQKLQILTEVLQNKNTVESADFTNEKIMEPLE